MRGFHFEFANVPARQNDNTPGMLDIDAQFRALAAGGGVDLGQPVMVVYDNVSLHGGLPCPNGQMATGGVHFAWPVGPFAHGVSRLDCEGGVSFYFACNWGAEPVTIRGQVGQDEGGH